MAAPSSRGALASAARLLALAACASLLPRGLAASACAPPGAGDSNACLGTDDAQSVHLLQTSGHRVKARKGSKAKRDDPLKILFVGNSFTYGPPQYNSTLQINLPRLFKLVAESMGHKVHQEEDTIGGCSVYMHRPSINPQGLNCSDDKATCTAVETSHINLTDGCTIAKGIGFWSDNAPCPQRLAKQDYGAWDVVVLQDHSALPSVVPALNQMLAPSVSEYSRVLREEGKYQDYRFDGPIIAMYMTWSYYDGMNHFCPGSGGNHACYPNGTMNGFTPDCETNHTWYDPISTHPCQAYSLARGYSEMLEYGAKVVVPCGLAWEAARGSEPLPQECKASIDSLFPDAGPLSGLDLPLKLVNESYARWSGAKAHALYRYAGPDYNSSYCDDGCHHDHHPSALGAYLNSLVFFATLFKESPLGADWPRGQVVDGLVMPTIDEEDAKALQQIAHDVVLPHLDVWWSGSSAPKRTAEQPPVIQPSASKAVGRTSSLTELDLGPIDV